MHHPLHLQNKKRKTLKINSISKSKIEKYKACPFSYYLTYHLGLGGGTSWAAEAGTLVHIVFEKLGEAKRDGIENPTIASTWYDEILYCFREEGIWKLSNKALEREKECNTCSFYMDGNCNIAGKSIDTFAGCPIEEFKDVIKLIEKIVNDKTLQNPINKKVLQVEEWFELKIKDGDEEIPVVGLLDIVNEINADTLEITDYKSGKHKMSYNECLNDPQLLIYNLAVRNKYKQYKNILITIYYLRSGPITLSFEPDAEKRTEESIKKYWHLIKGDTNPSRRCDRSDGTVNFDFYCKNMCSIELCKEHHKEFVRNGRKVGPPSETKVEKLEWLKRLSKNSKPQLKK